MKKLKGNPGTWLQTPTIKKSFSLELLECIIAHNPSIFIEIPEFEFVLRENISHALHQLLNEIIESDVDLHKGTDARSVFKVVATMLQNYYMVMPSKMRIDLKLLFQGKLIKFHF